MCITAFLIRRSGRFRFIFIGNRDEFPRGTDDVQLGKDGVLCARDEKAGGTQCGYNTVEKIIANLTNVRKQAVKDGARSRGMLVDDALHGKEIDMTTKLEYAGFNLLTYNVTTGIAEYRTNSLQWTGPDVTTITEGAHCVSNSFLNDSSWPKVTRLRASLETLLSETAVDTTTPDLMQNLSSLLCETFNTKAYPRDLDDPEQNPYASVEEDLQSGIWVTADVDGRVFRTRYQTVMVVEQPVETGPLLLHYWYRTTDSPTQHGDWRQFTYKI